MKMKIRIIKVSINFKTKTIFQETLIKTSITRYKLTIKENFYGSET